MTISQSLTAIRSLWAAQLLADSEAGWRRQLLELCSHPRSLTTLAQHISTQEEEEQLSALTLNYLESMVDERVGYRSETPTFHLSHAHMAPILATIASCLSVSNHPTLQDLWKQLWSTTNSRQQDEVIRALAVICTHLRLRGDIIQCMPLIQQTLHISETLIMYDISTISERMGLRAEEKDWLIRLEESRDHAHQPVQ